MDHFLHEIEITNFKSIRHQKIEGCKRINVFIGYPNVGKSNILEALSMLSYVKTGTPLISQTCRITHAAELFFDGNIREAAIIQYAQNNRVTVNFNSDELVELSTEAYDNVISQWRTIYQYGLEKGSTNTITKPNNNPLNYVQRIIDRTSEVNVKKYSFTSNSKRNEKGLQSLSFPDGENLFYLLEGNSELRKEVVEIFAPYALKLAFEKGKDYTLRILKTLTDDTIFLIPFHQIADTIQRLIFHKAAIKTNTNTILLFEEPEAHMFPPYISKFTADVMFDDNNNQFFINTHSPFVINDFMENLKSDELSIYVVGYKKVTGETVVRKLTDEELHEIYQYGIDIYYNLEKYLEHEEQ